MKYQLVSCSITWHISIRGRKQEVTTLCMVCPISSPITCGVTILISYPDKAATTSTDNVCPEFSKSPPHHTLTGHPPSCSCKYLLTPPVISLVPWAKPSWARDGHPAWATVYDPRSVLARAHSSSVDPQLSYSKHDSSQHSNTVNLSPLTVEDQVSSVNITTVVRVSECPRVS